MSENILKKTKNWYRCVGTVYEKNLEAGECDVPIYENGSATGNHVHADCIKGSVAISLSSGVVTLPIYFASKGTDGKDNRDWPMAKAMMEKWEPRINGNGEEPTLVALEGVAEGNDYVSQTGEAKYTLRYRVRRANTRVAPDENHGMTVSVTAFIRTIKHEVRGETETGRLAVDLYCVNNKGACFPIHTFVEEDLADDFESTYEAGQTAPFDLDVVVHHVGGTTNGKKRAFGRGGSVSTNTGFDVTELMIVGADDPIEEPDELTYEDENGNVKEVETDWINPATMKKAFKVRDAMIEEMVKAGPTSSNSGKKSLKERKNERKMAKTTSKPPFDADDDDDDF